MEEEKSVSVEDNQIDINEKINVDSNNNKENNENNENNETNKEINNKKAEILKKVIIIITSLVCIILFSIWLSPKTLQNDTFYTVKVGEYIFNNGISNLTEDTFSWLDLPYTYPHWLYDLGMFILYNSFGFDGIYLSTIVLTAVLGMSIFALSCKKSKNELISGIISLAAMYLLKDFIAARAQLVTFILFTWEVMFIEKFLDNGKKRYLCLLLIIDLLIVNLHCAVFPFYFVLFMPYLVEYLFVCFIDWDLDLKIAKLFFKMMRKISKKNKEKWTERINKISSIRVRVIEDRKEKRKNPYRINVTKNHRTLILILLLIPAILIGFANPAGNGAFTYLFKTMQGNTMDSITEHQPTTLVNFKTFAYALVIFILILVFTDTKIKLHDLFMITGLTILALNSRRQISMFAIFGAPIMATLLTNWIKKYDERDLKKIEKTIGDWFWSIVIICLLILFVNKKYESIRGRSYINENDYPVEAAEWIINNLDYKNIHLFNEYNYGSYLLYKGIPVIIDSRCDLYTPEFNKDYIDAPNGRDIFSDVLNVSSISSGYESMFEKYGVTHIIIPSNSKLALLLEKDSKYTELYNDTSFKIFERKINNTSNLEENKNNELVDTTVNNESQN